MEHSEYFFVYHDIDSPRLVNQQWEIYSPKPLCIAPQQWLVVDLGFSFLDAPFLWPKTIELNFSLHMKGCSLVGHNFNQIKSARQPLFFILNNIKQPVSTAEHSQLFGDKNKIDIKRGDILGYLRFLK